MVLLDDYATVSEYKAAVAANEIRKPRCCPHCQCLRLVFFGYWDRHVNELLDDGTRSRERIAIRNCLCKGCGRKFGLLPACAYPHRQFGAKTIQAIEERLLTDPKARPGDFRGEDGLGPSERTVRRWSGWIERSFDEGQVESQTLQLRPQTKAPSEEELVGGRQDALGGKERTDTVRAILRQVYRWHSAGEAHRRRSDPCALRSYMRWLWHAFDGLILYLTRAPRSSGTIPDCCPMTPG